MPSENKCIYQSEDCIRKWAKGYSGKLNPEDYIRSIETILKKDYKRQSFTDFKDKKGMGCRPIRNLVEKRNKSHGNS